MKYRHNFAKDRKLKFRDSNFEHTQPKKSCPKSRKRTCSEKMEYGYEFYVKKYNRRVWGFSGIFVAVAQCYQTENELLKSENLLFKKRLIKMETQINGLTEPYKQYLAKLNVLKKIHTTDLKTKLATKKTIQKSELLSDTIADG